tara:strand:- start:120 stop:521 length:402 start_codon:yes stop_codon:yes gene_type:complete
MINLKQILESSLDTNNTAGVILEHAEHILIMKKSDCSGYTIPKGHIQKGETPRQGMVRELKEETQLELPHEPKFLYKTPRPENKGNGFMYVFHYLSDHELTPTLDKEHSDWKYVPINESPSIYYLDKFLDGRT